MLNATMLNVRRGGRCLLPDTTARGRRHRRLLRAKATISIVTRGLQTVILSIPALPAVPAARVIREAAEAYTRILCCELQNGMILPGLQFATSLKSTNHR
jgi:DNA-binding sugar fermentation-stimulating protein